MRHLRIEYTFNFTFYRIFFLLLSKIKELVLIFASFHFHSLVSLDNKIHQMFSFSSWLTYGQVFRSRFSYPFLSQIPREFYASLSWKDSGLVSTICYYTRVLIFGTIFSGSSFPPICANTSFLSVYWIGLSCDLQFHLCINLKSFINTFMWDLMFIKVFSKEFICSKLVGCNY